MHSLLLSLALFLALPHPAQTLAPVASAPPVLLAPEEISRLLPATVFFRGQSAPLQLRNAAAARFDDKTILFAALVDTSGYSTSVRERYEFYLVTETPLRVADKTLPAGAYGAGFLEDGTFVVMDIGGHDVLLAHTEHDAALARPRPLQIVAAPDPQQLRLYLGRSFVTLARSGT